MAPASNATAIEKGVDFASTAVMTPFASNASTVEIALSAAHLTAFAPPNKDAVSFYMEIAKSGVFVFASKEVKADAGVQSAELRVTHCK